MNRLDKLRSLQDPDYAMKMGLGEMVDIFKNMKGEPGYTPKKGVDYLTPEDMEALKTELLAAATPQKGVHYNDGVDGQDGEDGENGRNGDTPARGVDYWTREDREAITADVLKNIKVKDGVSPQIKDIVPHVLDAMQGKMEMKHVKGAPDPKDLADLIAFLKRGGFRGGAGTTVITGSSGYQVPTAGVVNGINRTFTWATAPNVIVLDNGNAMNKVSSDGTVNWTGTTTTVMTQAANFNIYATA